MPGFCGSCGAPVAGPAGFCGACGTRASAAVAPGGSAIKLVLIVVASVFVLGAIGIGGIYYAAHRYVKIAEGATGLKAGDVVRSIKEAAKRDQHASREGKRDGCLLLSKEEASAILEVDVLRIDGTPNEHESGEHCDFFIKPGSIEENAKRLKESAAAVKNDPNSGSTTEPLPPGSVDMLKNMARAAVEAARNGEAPYFAFTVERENGKLAFQAFTIADRLGGGDLVNAPGSKAAAPLGVGDEAALGMGESRLCVVKGGSALTLDLTQVTGGRAKGIALANTILARL